MHFAGFTCHSVFYFTSRCTSLRSAYQNLISRNQKVDMNKDKIRNVQTDRHGPKIIGPLSGVHGKMASLGKRASTIIACQPKQTFREVWE